MHISNANMLYHKYIYKNNNLLLYILLKLQDSYVNILRTLKMPLRYSDKQMRILY
jgi:hypothetical protein